MMKKCTQQDLRFWKNMGSKRSKKKMKKGGQQDRNFRKKLVQMLGNGHMTDFAEKFV